MALLLPPPPPPKRPTGEHTEGSASAPSSNLNPEQTGCKHIAFRVKAPFEWSSGQRTLKILEMLDPNVSLSREAENEGKGSALVNEPQQRIKASAS